MPTRAHSTLPPPSRITAALLSGAAALLVLAGCSGAPSASVGDAADVDVVYSGKTLPFAVTVTSFEKAPAEVQDGFAGDDTIYFANVDFTFTGEKGTKLPPVYGNVYAALDDGSFASATFTGLPECTGNPERATDWLADLSAGETVSVCVPVASADGKEVVGVYVGSGDVNDGGTVWKP
ncbi:hypothetical protein [Leifsonia sp. WHRI 6310E]|uniref:hypothetical protein n=1 Tax=Leifsonia sp. WHRI 6310E TaxID=3162562 RepID=UPI0032EB62B4